MTAAKNFTLFLLITFLIQCTLANPRFLQDDETMEDYLGQGKEFLEEYGFDADYAKRLLTTLLFCCCTFNIFVCVVIGLVIRKMFFGENRARFDQMIAHARYGGGSSANLQRSDFSTLNQPSGITRTRKPGKHTVAAGELDQ